MKICNDNKANNYKNNKYENKELFFNEFNKNLEYIINCNSFTHLNETNQLDKFGNNDIKTENKDELIINQFEEKHQLKNNNEIKNKRLNILEYLNDDSLSEYFSFKSPYNENEREQKEINVFNQSFNDFNNEKESIFYFIQNKNQNKAIKEDSNIFNLDEIKNLKNNQIILTFGEKPYDIYYKIINSKKKDKELNLELFSKYFLTLNKFIIKESNLDNKKNELIYNYCNFINNKIEIDNDENEKSIISKNIYNSSINSYENKSNNSFFPKISDEYLDINNFCNDKKIKENFLKTNFSNIKNEICNKYNINLKNRKKTDQFIKEHKFEYKHKKKLLKRGKKLKKIKSGSANPKQ